MQRNNLKMCLRSTDSDTDTLEVAKVRILIFIEFILFILTILSEIFMQVAFQFLNIKAYGGGGSPSSSSFIIRMDEYNQWLSDSAS